MKTPVAVKQPIKKAGHSVSAPSAVVHESGHSDDERGVGAVGGSGNKKSVVVG